MSFRDFTFPEVQQALGLSLAEADLFSAVDDGIVSAESRQAIHAKPRPLLDDHDDDNP